MTETVKRDAPLLSFFPLSRDPCPKSCVKFQDEECRQTWIDRGALIERDQVPGARCFLEIVPPVVEAYPPYFLLMMKEIPKRNSSSLLEDGL
jgi:hypothetical protein